MATRQFDVEVDELPVLTPEDMKGWDHEAVSLVLEYQVHGWTGRISSKGHAILHAPDGQETTSVGRKWRYKRSAEIGRRKLNQWKRRKQREREEQERTNAFGLELHEHDVQLESPEPPWQIARSQSYDARLRMQKMTRDWWDEVRLAGSGNTVWQLLEEGDDDWVLVSGNRADKIIHIVAIGPNAVPDEVEKLRLRIEHTNQLKGNSMEETGPLTGTKYPCKEPGCGRSFDSQGALNLHGQKHVYEDETCPLCPRVLSTPAAFGRHIRSALHRHDPRLPMILESRGMTSVDGVKPGRKLGAERDCEYGCGVRMPGMALGGHHRAHKNAGHVKVADGGDGATQVMKTTKVITTPDSPPEVPEAATEAPAKPERVVVQAVPLATVTGPPAVNGTGHGVLPADLLNQVRALVNPEMAGEMERLRIRNIELEAQVETLTTKNNDLQAFKDMIKEATSA